GVVSPNPAIQNNWCSTVLVRPAELREAIELDASEEIAVRLVALTDVNALIRSQVIHHVETRTRGHGSIAVRGSETRSETPKPRNPHQGSWLDRGSRQWRSARFTSMTAA